MPGCRLGKNCSLGQNVYIGSGVVLGNNVKIQNNVSVYAGTVVEDDVFLGPSCVLTNVTNPRAQINRQGLYETTLLRRGTTVGANATVVCGITVGRYTFLAAGAVLTGSTHDYSLMVGVPARRVGWMSRHGHRLTVNYGDPGNLAVCPESGWRYAVEAGNPAKGGQTLRCLDWEEDRPLEGPAAQGKLPYAAYKRKDAL
jgi:UDP-2-acetamido-3-amino-2,3-dideoxy-glucuronate N-acetyltransferase